MEPENFKNPGQEPLDETDSVDFTCFYSFFCLLIFDKNPFKNFFVKIHIFLGQILAAAVEVGI